VTLRCWTHSNGAGNCQISPPLRVEVLRPSLTGTVARIRRRLDAQREDCLALPHRVAALHVGGVSTGPSWRAAVFWNSDSAWWAQQDQQGGPVWDRTALTRMTNEDRVADQVRMAT
jgi:hypothetical protein